MQRNLGSDTSDTYNINMSTFEDDQLEEFLAILNNFSIAIDGSGTKSAVVRIN